MSKSTTPPPAPPRRGAPRGNANAAKGDEPPFAAQLVAHQKRLGYTDVQMGAALDIGESTYRAWRNGDPKRTPLNVTQEGALARLEKLQLPAKST